MVAGWVIPAAISAGSSILSGLTKGKRKQVSPEVTIPNEMVSQLTPEQREAISMMMGFSKTGKIGDYTAGEEYGGALGNYDKSALEGAAQSKIMAMLTGGGNETFNMGTAELRKLLAEDTYDPMAAGGIYGGFKKQALREQQEGMDAMKRNLAVTGNLYSTNTGKQAGLLAERTQDSLQSKLAQLADTYAQRKLAGAQTALQAGETEQAMGINLAGAASQLGGIDRALADAKAKAAYSEWVRSRGEKLKQLDTAKDVAGMKVPWIDKEVRYPAQYEYQDNPWTSVLNNLAGNASMWGMFDYLKG